MSWLKNAAWRLNGTRRTACHRSQLLAHFIRPQVAPRVTLSERELIVLHQHVRPASERESSLSWVPLVPTLMWARWHSTKGLLRKALWGVPIVITFRDLAYCPVIVEGRCMQPVLNPELDDNRDLVVVEKWSIILYRYQRGSVYLLRSPDNPKKLLIKRLLALEGDWIAVPGEVDIHKIPKGYCWVEGDNMKFSEDSRTKFGPVPVSLIEGRVASVIWPPRRVSKVMSSLPPGRLLITNANAFKRSRPDAI